MNKSLVFLTMILVSLLGADTTSVVEIKTGDGYKVPTNTVYGTFKSKHQSKFPWVCYDKRVRVFRNGTRYLKYEGCTRYNNSCKYLGRAHFGKYPNDYKSYKALQRCVNARPRFVD